MTRFTRSRSNLSATTTLDELAPQRKPRRSIPAKKLAATFSHSVEKFSRHLRAMDRLRAAVPDLIPCRDQETRLIRQFIDHCIKSWKGSSLYITGPPGTGKSITVESCLKTYRRPKTLINAIALPAPQALYQKLHQALVPGAGKDAEETPLDACISQLSRHFKNQECIVVIDELDGLITSSQDILYQLFDWAHSPNSKLILIGIANAAELTDRCLPLLAHHNIFPERIAFAPYNHAQLGQILACRLQNDAGVFHPLAAELIARRVAASSAGDARKFLDLCRKAITCSEFSGTDVVALPTIAAVLNAALESGIVQRIRSLPSQQQIVLSLIVLMLTGSRLATTVRDFRSFYTKETKRQSLPVVRSSDFITVMRSLNSMGFIEIKNNRKSFEDSTIKAKLPKEDLQFALKDVHFFSTLLQSELK